MNGNVEEMVANVTLAEWEEQVAFCITHGDPTVHALTIGEKLQEEDEAVALKCFLIAENFNNVFQQLKAQFEEISHRVAREDLFRVLQDFVEKILVFKIAINDRYQRPELMDLVSSYAELLIAYGQLDQAYEILTVSGTYGAVTERIFRKKGIQYKGNPIWEYVDVKPAVKKRLQEKTVPMRAKGAQGFNAPPKSQPMVPSSTPSAGPFAGGHSGGTDTGPPIAA
jgi:hypothetical protein